MRLVKQYLLLLTFVFFSLSIAADVSLDDVSFESDDCNKDQSITINQYSTQQDCNEAITSTKVIKYITFYTVGGTGLFVVGVVAMALLLRNAINKK